MGCIPLGPWRVGGLSISLKVCVCVISVCLLKVYYYTVLLYV